MAGGLVYFKNNFVAWFMHFGITVGSFWHRFGTSGLHFGTTGHHCGTPGQQVAVWGGHVSNLVNFRFISGISGAPLFHHWGSLFRFLGSGMVEIRYFVGSLIPG